MELSFYSSPDIIIKQGERGRKCSTNTYSSEVDGHRGQVSSQREGMCGRGGRDSRTLKLGTRCRPVVNFIPLPVYPRGKTPNYPFWNRPVWTFCRTKLLHSSGIEPQCPGVQPAAL